MRTLPDMLDSIKNKLLILVDCFYAFCEHYSSKINVWSWNKRWISREKGTGYRGKKWKNGLTNSLTNYLAKDANVVKR